MTSDVLHIVFTSAGATSLRKALKAQGRKDRVICLFDDLSFGPINPPDPQLRKTWVETELGFSGWPDTPEGSFPWAETASGDVTWEDLGATTRKFWDEALSDRSRKTVWMTRRSAMEYAGFLEWLWRIGDTPCSVVDLTECTISRYRQNEPPAPPALAVSLGRLFPEDIIGNNLFDQTEPLQATERQRHRELWRQLREDNAPFRIISHQGLVSAPITYFDEALLSWGVSNWRKVARIVGEVLSSQRDDNLRQTGDMVLVARINALVNSGMLEFQGIAPFAMRFSEVRLPRRLDSPPTAAAG